MPPWLRALLEKFGQTTPSTAMDVYRARNLATRAASQLAENEARLARLAELEGLPRNVRLVADEVAAGEAEAAARRGVVDAAAGRDPTASEIAGLSVREIDEKFPGYLGKINVQMRRGGGRNMTPIREGTAEEIPGLTGAVGHSPSPGRAVPEASRTAVVMPSGDVVQAPIHSEAYLAAQDAGLAGGEMQPFGAVEGFIRNGRLVDDNGNLITVRNVGRRGYSEAEIEAQKQTIRNFYRRSAQRGEVGRIGPEGRIFSALPLAAASEATAEPTGDAHDNAYIGIARDVTALDDERDLIASPSQQHALERVLGLREPADAPEDTPFELPDIPADAIEVRPDVSSVPNTVRSLRELQARRAATAPEIRAAPDEYVPLDQELAVAWEAGAGSKGHLRRIIQRDFWGEKVPAYTFGLSDYIPGLRNLTRRFEGDIEALRAAGIENARPEDLPAGVAAEAGALAVLFGLPTKGAKGRPAAAAEPSTSLERIVAGAQREPAVQAERRLYPIRQSELNRSITNLAESRVPRPAEPTLPERRLGGSRRGEVRGGRRREDIEGIIQRNQERRAAGASTEQITADLRELLDMARPKPYELPEGAPSVLGGTVEELAARESQQAAVGAAELADIAYNAGRVEDARKIMDTFLPKFLRGGR